MIACRYAKFIRSKSNASGSLGAMGFALPAAIGAKMGAEDAGCCYGDGYQMTIQELGTIFQTGVAVKIVVLNNVI